MKNTKTKKGISLIVLIITIIVMIILAAAIILSLNNSGMVEKSNKAKHDSDTANLKEYVNVLQAEYELMTESERAGKTSREYVNQKLNEKGYKRRLNEDGILLTENAVTVIDAGIKIGDPVIGYTLDSSKSSTTTSGKENTAKLKSGSTSDYEETSEKQDQSIHQTAYTTWKYIGISENGEILIAPDMPTSIADNQRMILSGKGGFLNGPTELDNVCKALYSTSKGEARSMNIEDICRILEYTLPEAKKLSDLGVTTGEAPAGNIGDYYAINYGYINKNSSDILKSLNIAEGADRKETLLEFVFESGYCLASSVAAKGYGGGDFVGFCTWAGTSTGVEMGMSFASFGDSFRTGGAIRPVVKLYSNVSVSYNSSTHTLTLN